MDKIRQQIYLGALLHDIGKFAFRSKERGESDNHEKLGEEFIREHLGKIGLLKNEIEIIVDASKHHDTSTYTRIADQINAKEREKGKNKQWRRYLVSIITNINIGYKNNEIGVSFYTPEHINLNNVLPEIDSTINNIDSWKIDEKESIEKHSVEFKLLINDIAKIQKIKDYESLAKTLYFILNKYTSRISSAGYLATPDITLFDHSRATAGLVNCLTSLIPGDKIKTYNPENIKTDFVLLKGDISGIQKFIYADIDLNKTGQSKGLAKRLRGRSLYINLVTDFFADLFIKEFDLAESNILYSGGGHFNLVLPKLPDYKSKIDTISKKINLFLRQKVSSGMSLILGYTECDKTLYSKTNEIFSKVSFELAKNKTKQNEAYLEEIFFNKTSAPKFMEDERIGKLIPYSEYIVELEANEGANFKDDKLLIADFKTFNRFFFVIKENNEVKEYDQIYKFFKERESLINRAKMIRINNTDFLEHASYLLRDFKFPISFAFKFIGQEAPKNKQGDILEFSDIYKLDFSSENKFLSYPQLAVIRLDVDNLGSIFGFGLGDSVSYSRIATLSRLLDHFFSGYFNSLANKYKLYITYSGGDDAFLIGSWYNVLHFAKELYEKFKEFSCNNLNITFSAGIFICNENYPIAKMADEAAKLEDLSKDYKNSDGKSKNAVTVFDHTLNWGNYCKMIEFGDKLLSYTSEDGVKDKEKLARSLVHRLLRVIKSCIDRKGHINVEKLYRNVAQLHYLFARHGFTDDKIKKTQEGLAKDIISLILTEFSKPEIIKDYLIPINYVILKTRKLNKGTSKNSFLSINHPAQRYYTNF